MNAALCARKFACQIPVKIFQTMNIYAKISLTAVSMSLLASSANAAWYNYYWSRGVNNILYQNVANNNLFDTTQTYSRDGGYSNRLTYLGSSTQATTYYMDAASVTGKFDANGYYTATTPAWVNPKTGLGSNLLAFHVGYTNSSLKGTETSPSALNINGNFDVNALFLEINPDAKATNAIESSTGSTLTIKGNTGGFGGDIGVEIRRQKGSETVADNESTRASFAIDMNLAITYALETNSYNYSFFRFAHTTNLDFTLGTAANNRTLTLTKNQYSESMATYLFNFTYSDSSVSSLNGNTVVNAYSAINASSISDNLILSGRTQYSTQNWGEYADMGNLRPIVNFMGNASNVYGGTLEIHSSVINLMKGGSANAISWAAETKPSGETSNITMRYNSYLNIFGNNQIAQSSSDRLKLTATGEGTVATINLNGTNFYARSLATDNSGGDVYAKFVFDYGMSDSGMTSEELAANVSANTTQVSLTGYGKKQTLSLGTMTTTAGNIVEIKHYMYGEDILLVGENYAVDNDVETNNIIVFDTSFYLEIFRSHIKDPLATLAFGENVSEYCYWYAVEHFNAEDYEYKLEFSEAMKALIPEPSTYALLLGVLALGFAAYKRRKN